MKFSYSLILLGSILFNVSCKRGNEVNPCEQLSETSASFTIKETLGDATSPDTDTVYWNNTIVLTAEQELDSYEWEIGNDPDTWTTRSVSINFWYAKGQTISIRLIGKRTPNKDCFPEDDGIDTIIRNVYIAQLYELPILGDYNGTNVDDEANPFTVSVDTFRNTLSPAPYPDNLDYYIANLPSGCNETGSEEKTYARYIGGKCFYITGNSGGTGSCGALHAYGTLSDKGTKISIKYSYLKDGVTPSKRKSFNFKGTIQ